MAPPKKLKHYKYEEKKLVLLYVPEQIRSPPRFLRDFNACFPQAKHALRE